MIAERIQTQHLRLLDVTAAQVHRSQPARFSCELSCVKTGLFDGRYEMRSGGRCMATLHVNGIFRPTVSAENDDGAWFFEPEERSIVVRTQDSLRELATVDLSLSDHAAILRFPDGRALVFTSDFWKGHAEFQTPAGDPVVSFRFHGLFRPSAGIEVLERGRQLPELSWLLMLGWSLVVGYF